MPNEPAPVNTGIPYELLVRAIFQEIHDQERVKTIRVKHNIVVKGTRTKHQIDVLWDFSLGGIKYKTIVQAKDWGSKIKKEHVHTFHDILLDIPGQPRGIIVTRSGFQAGARRLAKKYGIKLYLLREYQRETIKLSQYGFGNFVIDPVRLLLRMTIFQPTFHFRFFTNDVSASTTFSKSELNVVPQRQLVDDDGNPVGSPMDIGGPNVRIMEQSGSLSQAFTHHFAKNTYLLRGKRRLLLNAIVTTITIVRMPEEISPIIQPGLVYFILEDLENNKKKLFAGKHSKTT